MPERAVPGDPLAASNLDKTGHIFDEKAEKPDRYGEWLADDARIWRVYERLAKIDDDEKVKRWSGGLNNLALFATLFSGITTAFIIESQGDLKPDFGELAYRVQNATAHGRAYVEESFVVPGQARLVNCLWITSLILSLSAALISVMGQDWVEMYVDKPVCNPRQWAEIRSFRLNGVRLWYMPGVIATAPVLLHASLFLFGIGLAVFMTSDAITQNLCIVLCAIVAFLYAIMMFSPVLWSSSPFRSPATMLVRRWFCARFQRTGDKEASPTKSTAIRYITHAAAAISGYIPHRAAVRGWVQRWVLYARETVPHDSDGDYALPYSAAVYDAETATFVAVPNWLQKFPSWFQTKAIRILSRYGPDVSSRWTVIRRWFCTTFGHIGNESAVRVWTLDFLLKLQAVFSRILARYGTTVSNAWMATLRLRVYITFLRDRDHDDVLPYTAAVYDTETASFVAIQNPLSWHQTTFNAVLAWIRNSYPKFPAEFSSIFNNARPDVTNGWLEISQKPSLSLVADSLSWLSSASSSPEVAQLIVLGHCDHVTGLEVMKHPNAQSLIQKLCQYADENWDHMGLLDLCRYVTISANAGLGNWPDRVWQRVREVRDAETSISQDFLLAYAHLTDGLRYYGMEQVKRLCARIPECNPITLQTLASVIAQQPGLGPDKDAPDPRILIVLMNKWRDALPSDLSQVDRAFQAMLPKEVVNQRNKLSILCQHDVDRELQPIDGIIHSLVAFFVHCHREQILVRPTRDLVLSLASRSLGRHTCLAAMFGDSEPDITKAAWTGLPAHDIMSALQNALFVLSANNCDHDLQPRLARTIARCIWPPFPLLATSNISAQTALSHGLLLFQLVRQMSSRGALPDDLFRPVLEHGALAKLAAFLHESPRNGGDFLYVLGAIALWIKTRSDTQDRLALFESFIAHPTTAGPDDAVWDLVNASGTALASVKDSFRFVLATDHFMSTMRKLRTVFPERMVLWKDIARQYGANKHRFSEDEWRWMCREVKAGTGFDPEEFASENSSRSAGAVVQGEESATGGSSGTIQPTNGGVGANSPACPAPDIAWIAAGATPEGGI